MTLQVDLSAVIGLEDFLGDVPDITRRSMSIAMNDTLKGPGLAEYRRGVEDEINLPKGYVNSDRLAFNERASPDKLVASIVGRQRPTSLARFAAGAIIGGKGGVTVRVQRGGGSKTFKKGFLVRLNAGAGLSDDNYNVGLAVRLDASSHLNKKDQSRMVHLDRNVVLLYGPSIDQVLRTSVADEKTPAVVTEITTQFYRQFARLAN